MWLCVGCGTVHNIAGTQSSALYGHYKQYPYILTNSMLTYILFTHAHIPGREARLVTGSPELSLKSFSCSASKIFPFASWASKTEHLVFSAISASDSPFSHLLRAPRLASWRWPDPNLHTPQDSTTRWGGTSSHWLAAWPTVSLSSWWSVGVELMLRRVWAPGKVRGQ